ncbi:MAG: WbqC family protein [Muribaculaceae bacterium]
MSNLTATPIGSAPEAVTFSSMYAGSVQYYARMVAAGKVAIVADEPISRRDKTHHRCDIIATNGPQTLAIPIEKVTSWHGYTMKDVRISEHGDWRVLHWRAIYSAYGKTPFFEYIAPELEALINRGDHWLLDFNAALHELIVEFLDLPITTSYVDAAGTGITPCRVKPAASPVHYHQIWEPKYGFAGNLSILDLLMNKGREAIFILLDEEKR